MHEDYWNITIGFIKPGSFSVVPDLPLKFPLFQFTAYDNTILFVRVNDRTGDSTVLCRKLWPILYLAGMTATGMMAGI